MSGLSFPRKHRLTKRPQFQACYQNGRRYFSRNFVVFVLPGPPEDNAWRLGTAVTRKLGGAVLRNRVKRLIREFFRLHQNEIQVPLDVVVVPKRRFDAKNLNLDAVREELLPLLKRCGRSENPKRPAGH